MMTFSKGKKSLDKDRADLEKEKEALEEERADLEKIKNSVAVRGLQEQRNTLEAENLDLKRIVTDLKHQTANAEDEAKRLRNMLDSMQPNQGDGAWSPWPWRSPKRTQSSSSSGGSWQAAPWTRGTWSSEDWDEWLAWKAEYQSQY